jgi:hypothetical protein
MTTPKNDKKSAGSESQSECGGGGPGPAIDASVQGVLGRKLRENYEAVVKEEVPEKFLHLLEELKQKEKAKGAKEKGDA